MSRRLTVLSLNTELTWRGGEGQTLALCEGLRARGHRSVLAARPHAEILRHATERGLECVPVAMRGELDLVAVLRLRGILRALRPDIVHMHTSHAHTLGVLASLTAGVGRRVVSRRVDFSIYRHALSLSGFKYRHGVDRYVAISAAVRAALIRDGIEAARIALVHSGVDPARHRGGEAAVARADLGVPAGVPLVGTLAHFGWHKSLETLIRAAAPLRAQVPEAVVAIVGEGDLRPQLEAERARSPAAAHVLLPGFRGNVADFLAAFDVFVMPSVMEGLCTAILDAFAVGVPVVASRAGGIPELVEHEVTGLLVPPGDPAALAAGIARMLREPDLRARVRAAAAARLERDFTHDAMVEGTLRVYRELLERRAPAEVSRRA